jgi:hypothetical protein
VLRLLAVITAGVLVVPVASAASPARSAPQATRIVLAHPKIAGWLRHYPRRTWVTAADFDPRRGLWEVKVFAGAAGEVAYAKVDTHGRVVEALTGPQVAWPLARGGGVGGKQLNRMSVWLALCAVFLLGLADFRRVFSLRNVDLLVLLSFTASLWYFNHGHVFASASLVYPPLAYLLARCVWVTWRGPGKPTRSRWPVWILVAATCFLATFRIGLTVRSSAVIDVGYAGVIGADRIADGRAPYGNFPEQGKLLPCGKPDANGEIHDRIQSDGRCETANPLGDTYGPVAYEDYLPGLWLFGWSGRWDTLPAVHFTTILFDLVTLLGLAAVGFRFGRARAAATLAFAWVAFPFTQYAANSNTNDTLMPAMLVWGFYFLTSDFGRGVFTALAGWTKFAALVVAPLWATYPSFRLRRAAVFAAAFAVATVACGWVVFLGRSPVDALHVFYERTLSIQFHRRSPFSIWDWAQYHAGLPDLHVLQKVLQVLLVAGALAVAVVPRRKTPLALAALTAALLIGFEIVLTHWSLFYIPWFFPFVALALLVGNTLAERPVPPRPQVEAEPARPREAALM